MNKLHIFNPCKKCLVQPCCNTLCEDYHKHEAFKELVLYIPNAIKNLFSYFKSEIKWMFRDEPIFIKGLLALLLVFQLFSIILCVGLSWALLYAVFS